LYHFDVVGQNPKTQNIKKDYFINCSFVKLLSLCLQIISRYQAAVLQQQL